MPDTQPGFEPPAMMRLPQVPPIKIPARRQSQFIVPPTSTSRPIESSPLPHQLGPYTEQLPVARQQQTWIRTPYPINLSMPGKSIKGFVPATKRSREASNSEVLLGCAFLIVAGLVALALLFYLSNAI